MQPCHWVNIFKLNVQVKVQTPLSSSLCPTGQCFSVIYLSELVLLWFIIPKQSLEEVHRIRTQHVVPNTNASLKLCCHNSHEVCQPCQCACGEKQEKYCPYKFWSLKTEAQLITGSLNSSTPHSLPRKDLLCHSKVQRPMSEADVNYLQFPSSSGEVT